MTKRAARDEKWGGVGVGSIRHTFALKGCQTPKMEKERVSEIGVKQIRKYSKI